jgi:hypothetical protein
MNSYYEKKIGNAEDSVIACKAVFIISSFALMVFGSVFANAFFTKDKNLYWASFSSIFCFVSVCYSFFEVMF